MYYQLVILRWFSNKLCDVGWGNFATPYHKVCPRAALTGPWHRPNSKEVIRPIKALKDSFIPWQLMCQLWHRFDTKSALAGYPTPERRWTEAAHGSAFLWLLWFLLRGILKACDRPWCQWCHRAFSVSVPQDWCPTDSRYSKPQERGSDPAVWHFGRNGSGNHPF